MASFTLKLGTLDLSNYTRVAQGDGLDPMDGSGFVEPQFNDSALSEGAPLVFLNQGNREMQFPLYLKAASKDALGDLMQSINYEIKATKPLRVEWKDVGATTSTFYDVVYARFDPDYNHRRAGQNWMGGVLHVWALPYGHTGSYRPLGLDGTWGSAVYTKINATTMIAAGATGAVDGDADAQLRVDIAPSTPSSWDGNQVIFATLPNVNWNPIINPSQFVRPLLGAASGSLWNATIALATGAPGSYGYNVVTPQFFHNLPNFDFGYKLTQDSVFGIGLNPSSYPGNIRVFASVRATERRGVEMKLLNPAGDPINSPVTATGWRGFSLVDLGRISMPSYAGGATQVWSVRLSSESILEKQNAPSQRNDLNNGDPYSLSIGQVYIVPEDTMQVFFDSPREPHRSINFYGNHDEFGDGGIVDLVSSFTDAYGNQWLATKCQTPGDGFGFYPLAMGIASGYTGNVIYAEDKFINDVAFETELDGYLFTGGTASSSINVSLVGDKSLSSAWSGVQFGVNASGVNYFAINQFSGFGAVGASTAVTRPASPSGILMMRAKKQGPVWTAQLEWYAYANATAGQASYALLANITASSALYQYAGDIRIATSRATAADAAGQYNPVYSFRSQSLPSFAILPQGYYHIDSSDKTAIYRSSSDVYQRPAFGQRGPFQNLPVPSPVAHFAVSQPIDTPSDFVQVSTFIRERFTYVR